MRAVDDHTWREKVKEFHQCLGWQTNKKKNYFKSIPVSHFWQPTIKIKESFLIYRIDTFKMYIKLNLTEYVSLSLSYMAKLYKYKTQGMYL